MDGPFVIGRQAHVLIVCIEGVQHLGRHRQRRRHLPELPHDQNGQLV